MKANEFFGFLKGNGVVILIILLIFVLLADIIEW